jgi:hypothetical protein
MLDSNRFRAQQKEKDRIDNQVTQTRFVAPILSTRSPIIAHKIFSTASLAPPLKETELIQSLVSK